MAYPDPAQRLDVLKNERQDSYDLDIDMKTFESNCPLAWPSSSAGSISSSLQAQGHLDRFAFGALTECLGTARATYPEPYAVYKSLLKAPR